MSEEAVPEFIITDCDCGSSECDSIMLVMVHPVIRPIADTEDLCSLVHFPLSCAQGLIDEIRRRAKTKGIRLR